MPGALWQRSASFHHAFFFCMISCHVAATPCCSHLPTPCLSACLISEGDRQENRLVVEQAFARDGHSLSGLLCDLLEKEGTYGMALRTKRSSSTDARRRRYAVPACWR